MTEKTDEIPQSGELQIKTIHPLLNTVIAIVAVICLMPLLAFLFRTPNFLGNPLLFLGSCIGAFFAARMMSKRDTTLTISNNNLEVVNELEALGLFANHSFDLNSIIGYECYASRTYNHLVLYRKENAPYSLIVTDTSIAQVDNFLETKISVISRKNPLSNRTFVQAFGLGFLILLAFCCLQLLAIWLYNFQFFEAHHYHVKLSISYILKLLTITAISIWAYTHFFNKLNLRISGRYTGWVVLSVNMFFCGMAIEAIDNLNYDQVILNAPSEVLKHPKAKIFKLDAPIKVNREVVGYHVYIKSTRRSIYNKFTQYFTATTVDESNVLIGRAYGGKFRKFISQKEKSAAVKNARQRNERLFLHQLERPVQFYEVVFSDVNPEFNARGYKSSAGTTPATYPIIVLKPHYEDFKTYNMLLYRKILLLIGASILTILIGAVVIGRYR